MHLRRLLVVPPKFITVLVDPFDSGSKFSLTRLKDFKAFSQLSTAW